MGPQGEPPVAPSTPPVTLAGPALQGLPSWPPQGIHPEEYQDCLIKLKENLHIYLDYHLYDTTL